MYAKVFASLWIGSLRGDPHAQLVFVYMLANCDADGIFDQHHRAIADATGLSIEEVFSAVLRLERPDSESRTPTLGGARIARMDDHRSWGWVIVNYLKYREQNDIERTRALGRDRARRFRESHRNGRNVTANAESRQAEAEAEAGKIETAPSAPSAPGLMELRNDPFGPGDGVFLRFPVVGVAAGLDYPILCSTVRAWASRFPDLDVPGELRRALAWLEANRRRRKTPSGVPSFVVNWLGRAQDDMRARADARVRGNGDRFPGGSAGVERPSPEAVEAARVARAAALEASRLADEARPTDPARMAAFETELEVYQQGKAAAGGEG